MALIERTDADGHIIMPIPHEPGQSITVVPMTVEVFEAALEVAESKTRKSINDFDRGLAVEVMRGTDDDEEAAEKRRQARANRVPSYGDLDKLTMLEGCVVDWSYDVEVNDANLRKLDPKTADWCARAIYARSIPDTKEEQGNA